MQPLSPSARHRDFLRADHLALIVTLLATAAVSPVGAQEPPRGDSHAGQHSGDSAQKEPPLSQPGNAAFAAIREVVLTLHEREDTDWSEVDLEALRRHLRDMQRFTLGAEIVERTPVDGGLRVAVRGNSGAATDAIRRGVTAHAPMLEKETGWDVAVTAEEDRIVLRVAAETAAEARRIRGLGYIGLMATGAHHQRHHWMIANGRSPHQN